MKKKLSWILACCLIGMGAFYGCDDNGSEPEKNEGEQVPGDKPADPGDKPADPGDKPADPSDKPADPGDKPADPGDKPADPGEDECNYPDADGDTIADGFEDSVNETDTDGDTVPDYKDDDSDGDTIPDKIEGGTEGCSGREPVDTDFDGIPDYRDEDSDNNGIPDKIEAGDTPDRPVDTDGDTVPDFLDEDNDGDTIADVLEISGQMASADDAANGTFSGDCDGDGNSDSVGTPDAPVDCNADGIPDYMDPDSDGDTVPDKLEGVMRWGSYYARYSGDADGDGISDAEEAGDKPEYLRDTDADGTPDILDADSDGDGLPDKWEKAHESEGYNPFSSDSDDDGVSDLVEFGAGSSSADPKDTPQSRGNFVFVVPYEGDTSPKKQTMSFETFIQTIDLYIASDGTRTMYNEINVLKSTLPELLQDIQCAKFDRSCKSNFDCRDLNDGKAICSENGRCIATPDYNAENICFSDLNTGIGWWAGLGSFNNASALSPGAEATVKALENSKNLNGKENNIQPAVCAISDKKEAVTYCPNANCYSGSDRIGCVGYRPDAFKVLFMYGDESNYDAVNWSVSDAKKWGPKFREKNINYVGLWGKTGIREQGFKQMACYAGSCDSGKCAVNCDKLTKPEMNRLYMAETTNGKITEQIRSILDRLAKGKEMRITVEASDIDKDAAKLIAGLDVNLEGGTVHGRQCTKVDPSIIKADLQHAEFQTIQGLKPGVDICYDVIPVEKQTVFKATDEPQVFKARIKVRGDGSVLNSGIAYFLVPPHIEEVTIN